MKTLLLATLTLLSLSSFAGAAHASRALPEERAWCEQTMAMVKAGAATLTPVDLGKNILPAAVRTELEAIAADQSQIWGDTILEGDYLAEEAVNVEGVQIVQMNSSFLGYRVTYSSVAFETADCNPDENIKACTPGRIVESSYVAPSLKSWFRDDNALAEFISDGE